MKNRIQQRALPQIWSAPPKIEKFNKVWESIKSETKAMQENDTKRDIEKKQCREIATLN